MPRSVSRRQQKVESLVRDALSLILIDELHEVSASLVTVTRVEMTPELQSAKVFISLYGPDDPAAALEHLRRRAGAVRQRLAGRVELKYNPKLFFELDPGPAFADRLDELIAKAKSHDDDSR